MYIFRLLENLEAKVGTAVDRGMTCNQPAEAGQFLSWASKIASNNDFFDVKAKGGVGPESLWRV